VWVKKLVVQLRLVIPMSNFQLEDVNISNIQWSYDAVDSFLREKGGLPDVGAAIFRKTDSISNYVARYDGEVIALCQVQSEQGHIKSIGVVEEYRQRGVGEKLILSIAESLTCDKLTASPMSGTRDFYEKVGFEWDRDIFQADREEIIRS